MRYAIPITPDTQAFITKFLNKGVVPEIEERGAMFVLNDDESPPEILPANDELFRVNSWDFKFLSVPVWVFKQ